MEEETDPAAECLGRGKASRDGELAMQRGAGELQLKVCSARHLGNERSISTFVQVGKDKTSNRKCAVGQSNVYWNHKFTVRVAAGEEVRLEVKNKESFLSPVQLLGVAVLELPDATNQIKDVWVPILDPHTNAPTHGELHCVMQFERLEAQPAHRMLVAGSHQSVLSAPAHVGAADAQRHLQPQQQQQQLPPPLPPPRPSDDDESRSGKSARSSGSGFGATRLTQRPSTDFDGHAAALTINELMHSLESVKKIIEAHNADSSGSVMVQNHDPERLHMLRSARNELENIQVQIENEASLSTEWRTKLVGLAEAYADDLAMLLSTQAWDDINRRISHRRSGGVPSGSVPPAVPPKPLARKQQQQQPPPLPQQPQQPPQQPPPQQLLPGPKQPVEHLEETKSFSLDSLELFDALLDQGYAMQVLKEGDPAGAAVGKGDKVTLEYTTFIWDSVNMQAVSYASSKERGLLTFVVGDDDQPVGLSLGLEGHRAGTAFVLCISPAFAFGENGTEDVPPNTHVMYEGTIARVESVSVEGARFDHAPKPTELLKKNRASIRFPARQSRVSLAPEAKAGAEGAAASAPGLAQDKPGQPTFEELSSAFMEATGGVPEGVAEGQGASEPPPLPPRSDYARGKSVARTTGASKSPPAPPVPLPPRPERTGAAALPDLKLGDWLKQVGFEQFADALHKLGVDELADLEHLQPGDFGSMGMRLIQARKFAAQLAKLGIMIPIE